MPEADLAAAPRCIRARVSRLVATTEIILGEIESTPIIAVDVAAPAAIDELMVVPRQSDAEKRRFWKSVERYFPALPSRQIYLLQPANVMDRDRPGQALEREHA